MHLFVSYCSGMLSAFESGVCPSASSALGCDWISRLTHELRRQEEILLVVVQIHQYGKLI